VADSIRAMVAAQAATMDGVEGWTMQAEVILDGAALTVTGADTDRIRAPGFIGAMSVGVHHQTHHLSLATGQASHAHRALTGYPVFMACIDLSGLRLAARRRVSETRSIV
jgi:hypothetical protein